MDLAENQCFFCEGVDVNLIQMDTNSLIIGSVYIEFTQLISEVLQIKIDDEAHSNMICTICKDLLSQFYVMKQQATKHSKLFDIRKKQILDMVVDFIDSTHTDCVVSRHSNLIAVHTDTSSSIYQEQLYNCNALLEAETVEVVKEPEIVEEEELVFDVKVEEQLMDNNIYCEMTDYEESVDRDMKEFVADFEFAKEDIVETEEIKFSKPEPEKTTSNRPKSYQKSNLDQSQKIWLKNELKQGAVVLDTPLGLRTQYCCKQCPQKTFSSENAFRSHLKSHLTNSEGDLNTKTHITADDQSFLEQKVWIQQQLQTQKVMIESSEGLKPLWSCSVCDFETSKRGVFRTHLQKQHTSIMSRGPSKHSCYDCRLRFDGENHLIVHRKCHRIFDVIAPYAKYPECEICNMMFVTQDFLEVHLKRHKENEELFQLIPSIGVVHRNGETFGIDEAQEVNDEDAPTCGHCLVKFASTIECKQHLMVYHATSFSCPFDSRVFDGIPTLSFGNHLRQCHPNIFPDLQIACSFCKMQFETVYEKLAHMKTCQAKMFQCDHCEKSFFRKAELLQHLKVVTGVMVFACHVCGKRCKDQGDLKTHHRSHTNIRPYPCPHCEKKYKTSSARASHVESHMEQTHSCDICNVKFRRRILYQRHMKLLHDEAYRQKCFSENTCKICNKSYLRKTHYKNHLKSHNK